eukprot:scaffold275521_cov14-Tisochrysis_lutea.AAC.1
MDQVRHKHTCSDARNHSSILDLVLHLALTARILDMLCEVNAKAAAALWVNAMAAAASGCSTCIK